MIKSSYNYYILCIMIPILNMISCTDDPIEIPEPDRSPPQAVIMYPVDGEPVSGQVIITVNGVDNDNVDSVQFYINQALTHTDSTQNNNNQFTYSWNTLQTILVDGISTRLYSEDEFHYISVIAFDPYGNSYSSAPIRSMVDNTDNENPSGYILNPFYGQSLSGTVDFTVIASDNDSIRHVGFYINNVLQINDTTPPYIFYWNTTLVESNNYYSLHAQIKDINNNTTFLNPILVYVNNYGAVDTNPPTGIISNPISGQLVNGEVNFTILAQDDQGIEEIQFFIDGQIVAILDTIPYTYIWNTVEYEENSEHTLSGSIIDHAGNITFLQPVLVTISNR